MIEGTDGQLEVLSFDLYDRFVNLREEKRYLEAKLLLVPIQARQCRRLFNEKILWKDEKLDEYVTKLKYSPDYGLDLSTQTENIF